MVYEDNLLKFRIEYNNQFIGEEELDEIILSLKHLLGNIADCNNKKIAEVGIIMNPIAGNIRIFAGQGH